MEDGMKKIDIEKWDRKEHFNFFYGSDFPFYNVNFHLDVTGLYEKLKSCGVSFHNAIMYFTLSSLCQIVNFLYRLENAEIVEYERIDPVFACLRGEEELFRLIMAEYCDDLAEFDKKAKEKVIGSKAHFDLPELSGRSNFVFISSLHWILFTSIDHTLPRSKTDAIPRISWGKYHEGTSKKHVFINYWQHA
jgi:chloramphenicol O-acetyltransferase type A